MWELNFARTDTRDIIRLISHGPKTVHTTLIRQRDLNEAVAEAEFERPLQLATHALLRAGPLPSWVLHLMVTGPARLHSAALDTEDAQLTFGAALRRAGPDRTAGPLALVTLQPALPSPPLRHWTRHYRREEGKVRVEGYFGPDAALDLEALVFSLHRQLHLSRVDVRSAGQNAAIHAALQAALSEQLHLDSAPQEGA